MKAISWARFQEVLKRSSRGRARFSGSRTTAAAMVFLYAPLAPDSDERGLWEIASIASPLYFDRCPAESRLLLGNIVRGYQAFFWRAVRTQGPSGELAFDKKELLRALPDALKWDREHDQKLKIQRKELRITPRQRLGEKALPIMQDLRSLPGLNGKKRTRTPYWRKNNAQGGLFVPAHLMAG